MAKKSCIEKAHKKKRLIAKFATKRAELKKAMANPELDFETKISIQKQLESLPLNSCKGSRTDWVCLYILAGRHGYPDTLRRHFGRNHFLVLLAREELVRVHVQGEKGGQRGGRELYVSAKGTRHATTDTRTVDS